MSGSTQGMADTHVFIESLPTAISSLPAGWRDIFDWQREWIVTRAPGRIDLIGGIADYSGSLVLQWPIQAATHVAVQRNPSKALRIVSVAESGGSDVRHFQMRLAELRRLLAYDQAREFFARQREAQWAAYVAGAFLILMQERNLSCDDGVSILIHSRVPEGKGVGSSAALEVASMLAVATAYDVALDGQELALLCQRVENLIVGAPCGVMDQMTAACGEPDRLLELLCQPAQLLGALALPEGLEVWGIDSGIRHSVGGADYRTVRTATFMGYRILAELAGLKVHSSDKGHVSIDDPKWKGYLANVSLEEFECYYANHLPEMMTAEDFLKRYSGITDRVTSVEPNRTYPVRAATHHPIYEHARVKTFATLLRSERALDEARLLGQLMFQSHESYSSCGLGSDGTDQLVRLVRDSKDAGLYGAKITGGGSGGTVAILGQSGKTAAVKEVARRYREQTGYQPSIISGSSPGASILGPLRLRLN